MSKIMICGASGFIGSALVEFLRTKHDLVLVTRHKDKLKKEANISEVITYSDLNPSLADEVDIVINLAGDNISSSRWSQDKMQSILSSRVGTTADVVDFCLSASKAKRPRLLSASAIGIYSEDSAPGPSEGYAETDSVQITSKGFLHNVARDWEAALEPAHRQGVDVTVLRFGVVMNTKGGALQKMYAPFKFGLGAILGTGKQDLSWVSLHDVVRWIDFVIDNNCDPGAYNIVAKSQSQKSLAQELALSAGFPLWLKLPAPFVRLVFGQMGQELLLDSIKVSNQKIKATGFSFHHTTIAHVIASCEND